MGEPVEIVDLGRDLIRPSGYRVKKVVPIKYIGLRPGEKLFEELISQVEEYTDSPHPKILALQENGSPSAQESAELHQQVQQLIAAAQVAEPFAVRHLLHQLVPEYQEPHNLISSPSHPHRFRLTLTTIVDSNKCRSA